MNDSLSNIESVVVRIVTDKPVRKTPYQVKGVFMKQYPNEPVISMINGKNREKYLYPRVQVKILNEQIFLIGLKEGVDPVLSLKEKIQTLDFGNISFNVLDNESDLSENQLRMTDKLMHYRFLTPWVALNQSTGGKFRRKKKQEKIKFLNILLAQNLIFIIKEFGSVLDEKVYTKIIVPSLFPKSVDEKRWGSFSGEFKTNFLLPSYIGIGNGLTRGYGTIFGMFNTDTFNFIKDKPKSEKENQGVKLVSEEKNVEAIDVSELEKQKKYYSNQKRSRKNKRRTQNLNSRKKYNKQRKKLSTGNKIEENEIEQDESKFNSIKYHQRQHKI